MVTLKNISKGYNGIGIISDISLEIPSNSIYGVIGKSGAGKSTLIRLMSLLENPDTGEIYFNSDRVDNLKGSDLLKCRHNFGMIFQGFNLFPSRNVFGNVAYPLEIVGESNEAIKNRVCELLNLVELSDKLNYPISKLSGGQKQRVAIARALANHPRFLFCDEATSALDPQTTKSVLQLIKNIRDKIGLTVVMVTHQMEVVREICDYVSVIDKGNIVESGTVKNLVRFPHTKIARKFISTLGSEEEKMIGNLSNTSTVCRLHFDGKSATKPILSKLIKYRQFDVNILSGALHIINNEPLGELVLEFIGTINDLEAAISDLKSQGIVIETLND